MSNHTSTPTQLAEQFAYTFRAFSPETSIFDSEVRGVGMKRTDETTTFKVGDIVAIHSRGAIRRGVVTIVGRKNVTVLYTTPSAIVEAIRYRYTGPSTTSKSVPFAQVYAIGAWS